MRVSVPLRGCGFEISDARPRRRRSLHSFRPLAGMMAIRLPRRNGGGGERREPVGALVTDAAFLRWKAIIAHGTPSTASGPPPPWRTGEARGSRVPSPCGDVVLKFCTGFKSVILKKSCFRPLAGMWF